ncbi:hypothetical protein MIMGU_mgv1a025214mg [Erythranthe guttata]|uniref:Uncharacterized protein n=1 Tax=Erythranthe guttata TaxID=4155 RepID=A0A022RKI2_ERYGU|nr:hypothetical protein MIMGU_mgv1a025214mg [Erythranthe guttata]
MPCFGGGKSCILFLSNCALQNQRNQLNTNVKKKLIGLGIDPVTHKPFLHLMTKIATFLPPQALNLVETMLGCFKDKMLHLLTKSRINIQMHQFATTILAAEAASAINKIIATSQENERPRDFDEGGGLYFDKSFGAFPGSNSWVSFQTIISGSLLFVFKSRIQKICCCMDIFLQHTYPIYCV